MLKFATMEIIKDLKNYQGMESISLAIGVFDGMHQGHVQVIAKAVDMAQAINARPAVLTFRSTPKMNRSPRPVHLTSFEHKMRLLKKMGCSKAFIVSPDDTWLYNMGPEEFILEVLSKKWKCRAVCVGENFHFGKGGQTRIRDMVSLFEKKKIDLNIIPLAREGKETISSSLIRQHIEKDDFRTAWKLLGRPYSLGGIVQEGRGLGREMHIPTANIDVSDESVLLSGIYACHIMLEERTNVYSGVLSVGTNPTVSQDDSQKVEVHLLDFHENIYNIFMEIYPVKKIGRTRKYSSIEELQENMKRNREKSSHVLKSYPFAGEVVRRISRRD